MGATSDGDTRVRVTSCCLPVWAARRSRLAKPHRQPASSIQKAVSRTPDVDTLMMPKPAVTAIVVALLLGGCSVDPGPESSSAPTTALVTDTQEAPPTTSSIAMTVPPTTTTVSPTTTTISERDAACRSYFDGFVSLSDETVAAFTEVDEIIVGVSEGLYRPLGVMVLLNQEADLLREIEASLDDLGNAPEDMEASVGLFRDAVAGAEEALGDVAFWIGLDRSEHTDSIEGAWVSYLESVNLARLAISSLPAC